MVARKAVSNAQLPATVASKAALNAQCKVLMLELILPVAQRPAEAMTP